MSRVEFYMTVERRIEQKIVREAERRNVKPADLTERLIEAIFRDNLVTAVLDDGTEREADTRRDA